MSDPITFTRPEPTQFVLLVAKSGRGTRTVPGTENFKPGDTEWATDEDLRDAGYISRDEAQRVAQNVQAGIVSALGFLSSIHALNMGSTESLDLQNAKERLKWAIEQSRTLVCSE